MTNEQDKAAFYQEHKDDPDVWGEPEEHDPTPRAKGLTATITVRFPAVEAAIIRRLATETGLTYSDIVRQAVRQMTQPRFTVDWTKTSRTIFYNFQPTATGAPSDDKERFILREARQESFTGKREQVAR